MPKITKEFAPADRYVYDFVACATAKGWAQLDTRQDASYYGNWINPTERKLFSYCEGDTTLTEFETDEEFKVALAECIAWHRERLYFVGIDPGFNRELKAAFVRLGFEAELH
jgi:hypothetical protein